MDKAYNLYIQARTKNIDSFKNFFQKHLGNFLPYSEDVSFSFSEGSNSFYFIKFKTKNKWNNVELLIIDDFIRCAEEEESIYVTTDKNDCLSTRYVEHQEKGILKDREDIENVLSENSIGLPSVVFTEAEKSKQTEELSKSFLGKNNPLVVEVEVDVVEKESILLESTSLAEKTEKPNKEEKIKKKKLSKQQKKEKQSILSNSASLLEETSFLIKALSKPDHNSLDKKLLKEHTLKMREKLDNIELSVS